MTYFHENIGKLWDILVDIYNPIDFACFTAFLLLGGLFWLTDGVVTMDQVKKLILYLLTSSLLFVLNVLQFFAKPLNTFELLFIISVLCLVIFNSLMMYSHYLSSKKKKLWKQ